jgi:DNA-binding transcriptional LysR family regulator
MPRRMLPTESGKRLYTRVVNAIETLESIPIRGVLNDAPLLIRLGTPPEFFNEVVLNRLSKASDILFTIRFGLAQDLIEQLVTNQIDCAIATQKIAKPELEYQHLFEETFWLVGPPKVTVPVNLDSPNPNLKELEQWLQLQPWISYSEELPIIRRFWRVVFGQRLNVNPQFIIPELRSIREAVSQGLGFSVLPDYLCRTWVTDDRLTLILQPEKAVKNSIWFAYRKSERQSQQVKVLSEQLSLHE